MNPALYPSTEPTLTRKQIEIQGYVQGIGFRPFIYRLAKEHKLTGFVLNQSGKVLIEVQGKVEDIKKFLRNIEIKKPKLAKIQSIKIKDLELISETDFLIKKSEKINSISSDILPDISICEDCKNEIQNPNDRRFLYPFTNCTNCGPRFSIIFEHPYDRIHTSMNSFLMCEECKKEYHDPQNRRFHAEPTCCPSCGPRLFLLSKEDITNIKPIQKNVTDYESLFQSIAKLLENGNILAIKGIGGYHIACSIEHEDTIEKLRIRKKRNYKPFAVMFPDIESIRHYCWMDSKEEELLQSEEAPIVLLKLKKEISISKKIIPGHQNFLGVFLPYTPLHFLIIHFYKKPLVMTSANISSEPIIYKEDWENLFKLADYILSHDRAIINYCDDSVISKSKNFIIFHRKSRGYCPKSFQLNTKFSILALGAELKNTIAITKKNQIIVSPYIGDLENIETFEHHLKTVELFKKLYYFNPEYVAIDYHPNFVTNKWAKENFSNTKILMIQHHHAHIVSCMFENEIQEPVLGLALDGLGYGITKNHSLICGAEVYLTTYKNFQHMGSIHPIYLIGGDKATKEIERIAFALAYEVYKTFYPQYNFLDFIKEFSKMLLKIKNLKFYEQLVSKKIQIYEATSCGRLFDGISYFLGLCEASDYEGHPAIALEQVLYYAKEFNKNDFYEYKIYKHSNNILYLDWRYIIRNLLLDIKQNLDLSKISMKFHNAIVFGFIEMLNVLRKETKINKVVLSGGCFQNQYLLETFYEKLTVQNYEVYFHKELSPNDENISLGQIVISNALISD